MANNVDVTSLLSKPWQKFLAKFADIETLKIHEWKEVHLLAYICKRFEELHKTKFALSFKRAPSKCEEIRWVQKIIAMMNSSNMKILKEYVDFVYDYKIVPKEIKIRSLGFFLTPGFGNEFNTYYINKRKISKSTELPPEYKQIADTLQLPVATYGDLAFIKMALEQSPDSESRAPYRLLFSNLKEIGFEPAVLNNLV